MEKIYVKNISLTLTILIGLLILNIVSLTFLITKEMKAGVVLLSGNLIFVLIICVLRKEIFSYIKLYNEKIEWVCFREKIVLSWKDINKIYIATGFRIYEICFYSANTQTLIKIENSRRRFKFIKSIAEKYDIEICDRKLI